MPTGRNVESVLKNTQILYTQHIKCKKLEIFSLRIEKLLSKSCYALYKLQFRQMEY